MDDLTPEQMLALADKLERRIAPGEPVDNMGLARLFIGCMRLLLASLQERNPTQKEPTHD